MLALDDPQWQQFDGGYQIKYDASRPLKRLEATTNEEEIAEVLDELWEELHHQGDIGLASCIAVPHLIRIGIQKGIADWRLIGLIAVIELQRHNSTLAIPLDYQQAYFSSIQDIPKLINANQAAQWDRAFASSALSALAASKGQFDMASVILELEDKDLTEKFDEFLEQY